MGKQKLTDEQKEELFETWKTTAEYAAITGFQEMRDKITPIELSTVDVSCEM